jgi:Na+/H+ antiporter NhaD/arsenite permease-like protein
MGEMTDFFNILLYGNASWLFLIIFLGIAFIIAWKVRPFALVCMIACLFQGINYMNAGITTNAQVWNVVILFVAMCLFLFRLAGLSLFKD